MSDSNQKKSVISRAISDAVFERFQEDLKKIYKEIRNRDQNNNSINKDGDFWDIQIRTEDKIALYYKSCAINFNLKLIKDKAVYKLSVSDSLKEHLIKVVDKSILKKAYNTEEISLYDFFIKYKNQFEASVNKSSYREGKTERKRQQYITSLLEKDSDCIVVDYEVAVENISQELGKITFNKKCNIKSDYEGKEFKELDLLVLKKNSNNKYVLMPVELKISKNDDYKKSICQINAYTRILNEYIYDFIKCYVKVIQQKCELGMFNLELANVKEENIAKDIPKSLALLLYDDIIPKGAQKVKKQKEIIENCETACGMTNINVKAAAVALKDNDTENKENIKAIFMEKTI